MDLYYNSEKISVLPIKENTKIKEIKKILRDWLHPQGVTEYNVRLFFNDDTELAPIVFETNEYDDLDFSSHSKIFSGSKLFVDPPLASQIDYLSKLPVDIFIKQITYLPFSYVNEICQMNKILYKKCTKYKNSWKKLIDELFSGIYGYEEKLQEIWYKLGLEINTYNYLVYTKLVEILDPITQLMIYKKQGDLESFNNPKFKKTQRFLALFLLQDKNLIDYLPKDIYWNFIDFLNKKEIDADTLVRMTAEMAKEGSIEGVNFFIMNGVNVKRRVLRFAVQFQHKDVVEFLIKKGANIDELIFYPLLFRNINTSLIKYLIQKGLVVTNNVFLMKNILLNSIEVNDLDMVKYLVENSQVAHFPIDNEVIEILDKPDITKYLIERGLIEDDNLLITYSLLDDLDKVKHLVETKDYKISTLFKALEISGKYHKKDVYNYLKDYIERRAGKISYKKTKILPPLKK